MVRNLNDTLYSDVVAGDDTACRQMIRANLSAVKAELLSFLCENPHLRYLRAELLEEGERRVFRAVHNMIGSCQKNPNPTGFIACHIRFGFQQIARQAARDQNSREYIELDEIPIEDSGSVLDVTDELNHYCELLGVPKRLIELRASGFTDSQIADELGIHTSTVSRYRQQLKRLYYANT